MIMKTDCLELRKYGIEKIIFVILSLPEFVITCALEHKYYFQNNQAKQKTLLKQYFN